MRWIIAILVATLALPSMGMASCLTFFVQSGEPIVAYQNSIRGVKLGVTNVCNSNNFTLSVSSKFPASIEPSQFWLRERGTQDLILTLSPGDIDPGLYVVTIRSSKGDEKNLVVKVEKGENPLVMYAPSSISFREGEEVSFWIVLENKGNITLNNVVVMFEREGRKGFYENPITLQPGERKSVKLELGDLKIGTYDFRVKAFSGSVSFTRIVRVNVEPAYAPITTMSNVRETKDSYVIEYTVTNNGDKELKDLFVTVEDAPPEWNVISPPPFDLKPNDSTSVEVILKHDGQKEANVTVSIYSGPVLIYEEGIEITSVRLHGVTGLLFGGNAVGWGLFILLLIGIAYLLYLHKDKIKRYLPTGAS